jgi:hypothetical protein
LKPMEAKYGLTGHLAEGWESPSQFHRNKIFFIMEGIALCGSLLIILNFFSISI